MGPSSSISKRSALNSTQTSSTPRLLSRSAPHRCVRTTICCVVAASKRYGPALKPEGPRRSPLQRTKSERRSWSTLHWITHRNSWHPRRTNRCRQKLVPRSGQTCSRCFNKKLEEIEARPRPRCRARVPDEVNCLVRIGAERPGFHHVHIFCQVPSKRIRTTRVARLGRSPPNAGGFAWQILQELRATPKPGAARER